MDAIETLKLTLSNVNRVTLSRLRPGDALEMQNEFIRLQAWLRSASELEKFPADTIERALRNFRQYGYPASARELLLVCRGCTQGLEDALIEDQKACSRLLEHVGRYQDRRRSFRKFYRALLDGYFSHDPDTSSSKKLQAFLSDHLKSMPLTEFSPDWLVTLNKYPSLLGDDPAGSMSGNDWHQYREIASRLGLSGDSWLMRKLVISSLTSAVEMDDASFRSRLPGLLLLLDAYPLYANAGLELLLDRQARCGEIDDVLGEFSVGLWGNPWLAAQQWQCSEPARKMLSHWLKRHLLGEFFGLLSDDEKSQQRRLNFWVIYSGDMVGMYFVLGQEAYASSELGLYKFRRYAKGLITKLPEEKKGMHICIMQFEHHHVVEFNHGNGAAYFYDTSQGLPSFYFGKGWVNIGAIGANEIMQGTDMSRLSKPMRHQDGRLLTWEGKFARELGSSEKAIAAFCKKYRCAYEETGGQQRIRPSEMEHHGREVWSILQGWGFSHSAKEQAYVRMTKT